MVNSNDELATESIGKLMLKLSVPAIMAQLINALYNVVDRIYLGQMEGIGALALTGVGVTFPIITLISAFAAMVGMGGGPLVSISLGKGDKVRAHKIIANCLVLLVIFSIVLTIVFLIFKQQLLMMFGASPATIGYATDYLGIYLIGTIFAQISLGMNPFINAQGFAKTGMLTVLIGAVLNIILDPIFIFVFNMGVKGAATATIISQAVSAVWVLKFLTGKKATVTVKAENMKLSKKVVFGVLSLGISPFIMQSTESLVMIVLNSGLQKYGGSQMGDTYVGAMTIIASIMQIALMPLMGLTQGAQPIIGYNYGAGNYERAKKAIKILIASCFTFTCFACASIMLFPEVFIGLFNDNSELTATTVWAIRIYCSMMFMMGLQTSCQNSFLALGQAKISVMLALFRKILILIPLAIILPLLMENGVFGIFLAEPIADFSAATLTVTIFSLQYKILLADKHKKAVV